MTEIRKLVPEKKTWIQRHARLIAIISAALVLVTFVVKEVFREDAKAFADSVRSAQSSYMSAKASSDQKAVLDQINKKLGDRESQSKVPDADGPFVAMVSELTDELEDSTKALKDIQPLAAKLDEKDGSLAKVQIELKKVDALYIEQGTVYQQSVQALKDHPENTIADNKAAMQAQINMLSVFYKARDERRTALMLVDSILTSAQNQAELQSERNSQYGVAIDSLFLMTWTLGLIAHAKPGEA